MKIYARNLAVGDVLHLHDWTLHVVGVERELAIGVVTAEFDFLIHFARNEVVDVFNRGPAPQCLPRAA